MGFLSPVLSVFGWFKRTFVDHLKSSAAVAVTITEAVKVILANPVTEFFANVVDAITHTGIATEIATVISSAIPKVLAIELAIEGLPDSPTQDQVIAWEQKVLQTFNVTSDKSKIYTILATQIYTIIQSKLADGKLTFAEGVAAVQEAYLAYQADLVAYPGIINLPVGTVLADGNQIVQSAADAIQEAKQSPNA